jgi:DNA-binding transcriptional regulator YiaG
MKIRDARTAEDLAAAVVLLDPAAVDTFERVTAHALAGSLLACSAYVRSLRLFVDEVSQDIDPQEGLRRTGFHDTLLLRGLIAPMSGWVVSFGFGRGVAASVAASARELAGLGPPIAAPTGLSPEVAQADVVEFERRVLTTLRLDDADPLALISRELGLSKVELGELFGVSRQAVTEWSEKGVPSGRVRDVSQIMKVVSILSRKLKPGRTAFVVRRPAPALGGRSLFDVLREDPENALAAVERAFDWSGIA